MKRLFTDVALGMAAGLAATAALNAWIQATQPKHSAPSTEEPSTVKAAVRGMHLLGVDAPSRRARKFGGQAVHWGYGAAWGGVVGAAASLGLPLHRWGGLPFGAGLWLLGDIWLLPKLGLEKPASAYPGKAHARYLGAHWSYGATLAALWMLRERARRQRRWPRAA